MAHLWKSGGNLQWKIAEFVVGTNLLFGHWESLQADCYNGDN